MSIIGRVKGHGKPPRSFDPTPTKVGIATTRADRHGPWQIYWRALGQVPIYDESHNGISDEKAAANGTETMWRVLAPDKNTPLV